MTKAYKKSHFLSNDHTEIFRACIWKVCLDAAKIIEVRRISFLSYGGYKITNFPKREFAFGILQSTEDNFGKQT